MGLRATFADVQQYWWCGFRVCLA